jgi:outer membrane lipoprotein-sorting protein
MKHFLSAVALFLSVGFLRADSLDAILKRMDQAAPKFQALTADVAMDTYQSIFGEESSPDSHTRENGTLQMQRLKKGEVRAILDFKGANARTIAVIGNVISIYTPANNLVTRTNVGDKSQMINEFLLLGFGSSGSELAKTYTIESAGTDNVGGASTTKLQLIPKDADTRKQLSKVLIWIPDNGVNPIQQQFFQPAQPHDNWRKVTYSNIVVNPKMSGKLELKLPAGVHVQKQ